MNLAAQEITMEITDVGTDAAAAHKAQGAKKLRDGFQSNFSFWHGKTFFARIQFLLDFGVSRSRAHRGGHFDHLPRQL